MPFTSDLRPSDAYMQRFSSALDVVRGAEIADVHEQFTFWGKGSAVLWDVLLQLFPEDEAMAEKIAALRHDSDFDIQGMCSLATAAEPLKYFGGIIGKLLKWKDSVASTDPVEMRNEPRLGLQYFSFKTKRAKELLDISFRVRDFDKESFKGNFDPAVSVKGCLVFYDEAAIEALKSKIIITYPLSRLVEQAAQGDEIAKYDLAFLFKVYLKLLSLGFNFCADDLIALNDLFKKEALVINILSRMKIKYGHNNLPHSLDGISLFENGVFLHQAIRKIFLKNYQTFARLPRPVILAHKNVNITAANQLYLLACVSQISEYVTVLESSDCLSGLKLKEWAKISDVLTVIAEQLCILRKQNGKPATAVYEIEKSLQSIAAMAEQYDDIKLEGPLLADIKLIKPVEPVNKLLIGKSLTSVPVPCASEIAPQPAPDTLTKRPYYKIKTKQRRMNNIFLRETNYMQQHDYLPKLVELRAKINANINIKMKGSQFPFKMLIVRVVLVLTIVCALIRQAYVQSIYNGKFLLICALLSALVFELDRKLKQVNLEYASYQFNAVKAYVYSQIKGIDEQDLNLDKMKSLLEAVILMMLVADNAEKALPHDTPLRYDDFCMKNFECEQFYSLYQEVKKVKAEQGMDIQASCKVVLQDFLAGLARRDRNYILNELGYKAKAVSQISPAP